MVNITKKKNIYASEGDVRITDSKYGVYKETNDYQSTIFYRTTRLFA
jgi:hypothetical protein